MSGKARKSIAILARFFNVKAEIVLQYQRVITFKMQ